MKQQNYFGDFEGWFDHENTRWGRTVIGRFSIDPVLPEPDFIWAVYGGGSYDGSAVVVFFDNASTQWQLVSAGHCSCYGLEGSWEPEDFDPALHFKAVKAKKRIVSMESGYYDWSGSTDEAFDEWLVWAVEHTSGFTPS
jgi:hypothetical protein